VVQSQLNNFLQLTVQTYSIIKETNGSDGDKTLYWKRELVMMKNFNTLGRINVSQGLGNIGYRRLFIF
jgi:hypothetical protein